MGFCSRTLRSRSSDLDSWTSQFRIDAAPAHLNASPVFSGDYPVTAQHLHIWLGSHMALTNSIFASKRHANVEQIAAFIMTFDVNNRDSVFLGVECCVE